MPSLFCVGIHTMLAMEILSQLSYILRLITTFQDLFFYSKCCTCQTNLILLTPLSILRMPNLQKKRPW